MEAFRDFGDVSSARTRTWTWPWVEVALALLLILSGTKTEQKRENVWDCVAITGQGAAVRKGQLNKGVKLDWAVREDELWWNWRGLECLV